MASAPIQFRLRPARCGKGWSWLVACASLLALLLLSPRVRAEEGRTSIHVQIVLDSSGSMLENDPKRLSSLAGMIFTDLAGPDDSVGILSMQKGKYVSQPLEKVGKRRKRVREAVSGLRFRGPTFCAEPLTAAADGLAKLRATEPDARQFVIFLSDGACPNDQLRSSEDVRDAARELGRAGVKIFSIGLFGTQTASSDPAADLRAMAAATDGEFFSASRAADLPQRFAAILGRIVGSEAEPIPMEPGSEVSASLDGFVFDASLIVTGSGAPIVMDKAEGPVDTALALPGRAPGSTTSNDFHFAAFGNDRGSHYCVLRIEEPAPGNWTFRVHGPRDVEALLIQNYALDPVIELGSTRAVYGLGESAKASAWLRGKGGQKIADEKFLKRVEFTVTLADPAGKERALTLKPTADGTFVGTQELDVAGKWTVRGRARMKKGGLDKRTDKTTFEVRKTTLALMPGAKIDLGDVPAGSTTPPQAIDLSSSEFPTRGEVGASTEALPGLRVKPSRFPVGPQSKSGEVSFTIETDHVGGPVSGHLLLELNGASVRLPVTGNVIPLSFWERWGKLILTIGVGLLLLFAVLFVLYGFVSPHDFPSDARINWGESLDRLKKNELVIRELPGTKKGFYRNAKLIVGGSGPLLTGGPVLAEIAVTGPATIVIRTESVELQKVNKFDDSKTRAVEGNETGMHQGEIYQVGKIYLRLR